MSEQELQQPEGDDIANLHLLFQEEEQLDWVVPSGGIRAEEIKARNVVSGIQINISESKPQSPKVKKPSPFILPQLDVQHFTGREDELKQLEQLLVNPDGPRIVGIVGLTGTGGMGKSALAFHFAQKYRDRFPDGVIGLRVDSGQVDTLAQRFASHAGVEIDPQLGLSAPEIMQSVFQQKQALLIFDNVEESFVHELHPGGDKCAVIMTTRNRGLLRSFGIPAIARVDLQRFSFEETEQLLSQILGEQRVTAEPEAVKAIHDLVGGLPLALQIVGSTLQDQLFTTLAGYAAMLSDEKKRLSYLHDPDDSDLDVRASFALSLKYLDEDQIALFACLGACAPEGFSLQTTQIVSDQNEVAVRSGMGRLLRLSLINQGVETGWFVLHPLLFLFSRELGQERNLLAVAEQRHTDYFSRYADEHRGLSFPNLDTLEKELNALLLTAKRLTSDLIAANAFYFSIEPFMQARGYWSQALELLDLFLDVAHSNGDFYRVTQFLLQRGQFFQLLARFNDAEQVLQESRSMALQIENIGQRQRSLAMVLNSLGGIYQRQGRFDEAVEVLKQSAVIEQELGNQRGQAKVLNSLGGIYQRQGKFDEATIALQQSYELLITLGNELGEAMVLNSLGGVYQRQGKFEEAVEAFRQSHAISVALGDERGQAMVLNSLGGVYHRQGKFEEAVEAFQKSFDIGNIVETHRAKVLSSWGKALLDHGEAQQATEKLKASFEIDERLRNAQGMRIVTPSLIRALTTVGPIEEAQEYCRRALAIAPDDTRLLRVQKQLSEKHPVSSKTTLKTGRIKRTVRNLAGYLYGFITPDDGSKDIYFGENEVDVILLPHLAEGQHVAVEVEMTARGPRATQVRQDVNN